MGRISSKSVWIVLAQCEGRQPLRSTTLKSKYIGVGSFAYFADRFDTRVLQHCQNTGRPSYSFDFHIVRQVWGPIEQQAYFPFAFSPSSTSRALSCRLRGFLKR